MKSNPLDNIKIASPCGANWNEMIGSVRKRFCKECSLNVYDLSKMTKDEAESLIIQSEGRLCVRLYKRSDGTIITQDCPKGLAAIKRKVSRAATAAFAMLITVIMGIASYRAFNFLSYFVNESLQKIAEDTRENESGVSFGLSDGIVSNLSELKIKILRNQ